MKRTVIIIAALLGLVILGFPVKQNCLSGQQCGNVKIVSSGDPTCVAGVLTRPLIAKITGLNLHYRLQLKHNCLQ